jgi:hypothetical protein
VIRDLRNTIHSIRLPHFTSPTSTVTQKAGNIHPPQDRQVPPIGLLDMRRVCFFHSQIQNSIEADSIGLEDAFVLQPGRVNLPWGAVELYRGLV